jgi:trimeric autotransporter adhesin
MRRKQLHQCLCTFLVGLSMLIFMNRAYSTPLAGQYTINPALAASATNFRDIASAITYLTGSGSRTDGGVSNTAPFGVSGAVEFLIAPGVYNETIIIPGSLIPGLSATNRLTFNGGNAENTILRKSLSAAPLIAVQECDYVTIKNIGVHNTAATSAAGIYIIGNRLAGSRGNGCQVKNCRVILESNNAGAAIAVTDASDTWYQSKVMADSVEIDSNYTYGGNYSFYIYGCDSTHRNRGIVLRRNQMMRSINGVFFNRVNSGFSLLHNTISNSGFDGPTNQQNDALKFSWCRNGGDASNKLIGNTIDGETRAVYLEYCASPDSTPFLIYNNMITTRTGGLTISQPLNVINYCKIYHNSIFSYNPMEAPTISGNALAYTTSNPAAIACKNNIFAVAATKDTNISSAVIITGDTVSHILNYNVYYNPSGGSGRLISRGFRSYTAANYNTKQVGGDSSVVAKPGFISNTNLRLANGCQFRGVDLSSEVPDDIDGNPRTSQPYAGCYEYYEKGNDIAVESIIAPELPIMQTPVDVVAKVRNTGNTPVFVFNIAYKVNDSAVVSMPWFGSLNPCDTAIVTFSGPNQLNVNGRIESLKIYTYDPNYIADSVPSNDTLEIRTMTGDYTIGDTLSDFKTFAAAVNALYKYGVSAPVTFQVRPGTYQEQVYLNGIRIKGMSAQNRITFDGGHADSVIVTASKSQEATFLLNFCEYISLRNLTINNTVTDMGSVVGIVGSNQTSSYCGRGVHIKSCKLNNSATTGEGVIFTLVSGGFSTNGGLSTDSIEIDSNYINGGSVGFSITGTNNASMNKSLKIRNNVFTNNSIYSVYFYGVYNPVVVLRNSFSGITSTASIALLGGNLNSDDPLIVSENKLDAETPMAIYFLSVFNSRSSVPAQLINNRITNAFNGIYITPGAATQPPVNYILVLNNSININRTGSTVGYGFYFSNAQSLSQVLIQNNIFNISAKTGLASPVYLASNVGFGNVDYNLYYNSTGPSLLFRDNNHYSGSDYKTGTAGGSFSYNEIPEWVSDSNLHLTGGCRFKGVSHPMVQLDLDLVSRSTTPDIGCYEFSRLATDVAAEAILTPGFPVTAGFQDLTVRLRNNGSITVNSMQVTYEINGSTPVTLGWSGTLAPCDTTHVTFSNVDFMASNQLKVYTSQPNGLPDDLAANDTISATIKATLSGVYTIGDTLADFKTFNEAVNALNECGVSGHVTFMVKSGTYNEQVEVSGNVNGLDADNRVAFMSAANNHDSVSLQFKSGANNNYVLRLNYASYYSFKNISITATDSSYGKALEFTGNSSYDSIYGCRIYSSTASGVGDRSCIYGNGLSGKSNVFENNVLLGGAYCVYWFGTSQTSVTDSNSFVGNSLSNATFYGFYANYNRTLKVMDNTVNMFATNSRGLYLTYLTGNFDIIRNTINMHAGGSAVLVNFSSGDVTKKGNIVHNLISVDGSTTSAHVGISLSQSNNVRVLHNNIVIRNGNVLNSYGMNLALTAVATSYNNEFYNNIVANTGGGCALYLFTAAGNQASIICDYNLLYSSGASLAERPASYPNPSKLPDLATWRAQTGRDMHSVSYRPAFNGLALSIDPNDSAVWALNGRGCYTDTTYTRYDRNGVQRPQLLTEGAPDIGAFEVTPLVAPPFATAIGALHKDSTQIFVFAGDTVATIKWDTSSNIPSSLGVRQYSGETAPRSNGTGASMYFYTEVVAPQGTYAPFRLNVNYHNNWYGTVMNKQDLRLINEPVNGAWNINNFSNVPVADTIKLLFADTACTSFGLFTGTESNNPLPLTLMTWWGKAVLQNVELSWKTAGERNVSHFIVERSGDNNTWNEVGYVKATGSSSTINHYSFTDMHALSGAHAVAYYRLKMVDLNHAFSRSKILLFNRSYAPGELMVYPNPFEDNVIAEIELSNASLISISITDITGKVILSKQIHGEKGTNQIEISNDIKPESGIYFMSVEANGQIQTTKLIRK